MMTKCNSLRSLKKRRRSVDKRSSARKERRKCKFLEEHQHTPPAEAASRAIVRNEPDKEQSKEWFPWWRSSTLINFYSWCQSSVTEVSKLEVLIYQYKPRGPGSRVDKLSSLYTTNMSGENLLCWYLLWSLVRYNRVINVDTK